MPLTKEDQKAIDSRMSVSERIRYFESRHTNNVYIVGHGFLNHRTSDIAYTSRKKVFSKKNGGLKEKTVKASVITQVDTGGAGGTFTEKMAIAKQEDKFAKPQTDAESAAKAYERAKFIVPKGMKICFYVPHGEALFDKVANLIEGFVKDKPGIEPVEVIPGGSLCFNYRLTVPDNLKLNVDRLRLKHDVILIENDMAVPLKTVLQDPRCQNATIHWMACRSMQSKKLNKHNMILGYGGKTQHYFDYVGGEPVFKMPFAAKLKDVSDREELMGGGEFKCVWD